MEMSGWYRHKRHTIYFCCKQCKQISENPTCCEHCVATLSSEQSGGSYSVDPKQASVYNDPDNDNWYCYVFRIKIVNEGVKDDSVHDEWTPVRF